MKNLLLTVLSLYCISCISLQAQLTEIKPAGDWQIFGQVKYVGAAKASLEYKPGKSDTTYLLLMRDSRYELKEYFSIRFNSNGETLGNLYELLISFFKKENRKNKNYSKLFYLGEKRVFVQHFKQLTGHQIMLSTDDGRILFGEGEVERLFNKK